MLSPHAPSGLSREAAFTLITELQEAEERLRKLRDGLERLLAEDADDTTVSRRRRGKQ